MNRVIGSWLTSVGGANFGPLSVSSPVQVDIRVNDGVIMHCANAARVSEDRLVSCVAPAGLPVGVVTLVVSTGGQSGEAVVRVACEPGSFGSKGEQCSACPVGALCGGGDHDPVPDAGFYRVSRTEFEVCDPRSACVALDQRQSPLMSNCALGYTGDSCLSCVPGFTRDDGACVPCPEGAWVYIVIIVALLLSLGGLAFWLQRHGMNIRGLAIAVDFLQFVSLLGSFRLKWPPVLRVTFSLLSVSMLSPRFVSH